jgi:hypothetical protein
MDVNFGTLGAGCRADIRRQWNFNHALLLTRSIQMLFSAIGVYSDSNGEASL